MFGSKPWNLIEGERGKTGAADLERDVIGPGLVSKICGTEWWSEALEVKKRENISFIYLLLQQNLEM